MASTCIVCLLFSGTASAEYLGLIHGRSSDPMNQSELSLEAGVVSGELGGVEYLYSGIRFNAHVSQRIAIFGDLGSGEFGNSGGFPYGLGAIYHLDNQRINKKVDIAFKASYHAGDFSVTNLNLNITGIALELLISGGVAENVSGYVNFGYHRVVVDLVGMDRGTQLGFGAGLAIPMGPGELYAGFDYIDEMTLGIGFRYFIQPREPLVQEGDEEQTGAESGEESDAGTEASGEEDAGTADEEDVDSDTASDG